jgi:ABC-2 type transport system ATP-binding protein
LQELRDAGRTVFLNSHLLQEVELICDHVAILHRGQLRYVGTLADLTPHEEGEIFLSVAADLQVLQRVVPGWQPAAGQEAADHFELTVPVDTQAEIDGLIDRLRAGGVSIRQMTWHRRTLEDAFLQLVRQEVPSP